MNSAPQARHATLDMIPKARKTKSSRDGVTLSGGAHSHHQCIKTSYRAFDLEETLKMHLMSRACEGLRWWSTFSLADG
jgi:hypothetical protein